MLLTRRRFRRPTRRRVVLPVLVFGAIFVHPDTTAGQGEPDLWRAQLEFGFTGATGNTSFSILTASASLARLHREIYEMDISGRLRWGRSDGQTIASDVQGTVNITRGVTNLATLGSREGFGEMAILDDEARSASATAAEDTTLLSLDRDSFGRVIEQNPVVARGVYRVLTERLRNTLAQVAAGQYATVPPEPPLAGGEGC